MGVNVSTKSGLHAKKFMSDIIQDGSVIDEWLKQNNVDVKLTPTGLVFSYGNAMAKAELEPALIAAKIAGNLSQHEHADIVAKIGNAVGMLMTIAAKSGSTLEKLPPIQAKTELNAPQAPGNNFWSRYPEDQMTTAPRVKLSAATRMYQPVMGTSPDSRYYVVAGSKNIKVAARYQNGILDVRIEGPGIHEHAAALAIVGFDTGKMSKGYSAMHLHIDNDILARKTLGAVIMGLGVEMDTELPNIAIIKGK